MAVITAVTITCYPGFERVCSGAVGGQLARAVTATRQRQCPHCNQNPLLALARSGGVPDLSVGRWPGHTADFAPTNFLWGTF